MLLLVFHLVVALGFVNQVSSSAAACSQAPYSVFNFLSGVPAAEAFCTAHFPPLQCTKTVPSTHIIHSTTTTTLVVATATTTTSVVSTTSYTSTATATTFTGTTVVDSITGTNTFVTTDSTSTITSTTSTSTTTVAGGTTTITQYSDVYLPAALKARDTDRALGPRKATTLVTRAAINPVSTLLSSLESKASAFIGTVCSCIEATPSCKTSTSITTVTSTSTSTASVTTTISLQGTTTVFLVTTTTDSAESTSTMDLASTTTVEAIAMTTLNVVATSTFTSTSTVTEPATRTYTRVYGPTSGYLYIDTYVSSYTFGGDPSTINTQCGSVCDTFSQCVAFFTDINAGTKECYLLSSAFSASKLLHAGSSISEDYAYNVLS